VLDGDGAAAERVPLALVAALADADQALPAVSGSALAVLLMRCRAAS
jgi:hypothetical protein